MPDSTPAAELSQTSKPFWQSKTLLGVLLLLLPALLQKAGVQLSDAETQDLANTLLELGGAAAAIYGRATAKHSITV